MKYFLTLSLGFLVGVGFALAGLYFNPLTQGPGPAPADNDSLFSYGSPVTSALAFTHGHLSRLPSFPAGIADLWEGTIDKSALSVVLLRGADGTSAVASRVSYPSERTDLLRRGVLLTDDWVVSVPGQGSFLIASQSNVWPFLKEMLIPVWYLGRPWRGPAVYAPTVGPAGGTRALVSGATGSFTGRTGTAAERYAIEAFDSRVGPRQASAELYWRLDAPDGAAVAELP